jgi:hypothetical protein
MTHAFCHSLCTSLSIIIIIQKTHDSTKFGNFPKQASKQHIQIHIVLLCMHVKIRGRGGPSNGGDIKRGEKVPKENLSPSPNDKGCENGKCK